MFSLVLSISHLSIFLHVQVSKMDKTQKEHILSEYYFDVKNPGSYLGATKLLKLLSEKYPGVFSLNFIKKWLNNQDAYAVQKQIRHRYNTPNVQVAGLNDQADMDLMSVENISKYNDGIKYLLVVIDIFSRFLLVQPLLNKKTHTVLSAVKKILQYRKFNKIRTDKGSEFINKDIKKFIKNEGIYLFNTHSNNKANYAERVIRTLRSMIFRMLRHNRTYRYIENLQGIVSSYNNSPHRSLKGLSPNQITKENEVNVWTMLYLKPYKFPKTSPHYKFKVGSYVRLSYTKHPFRRAYQQQYTTEIFKIKSRIFKQGIPLYKVVDLNSEPITGYMKEQEMISIDKNEESLWYIEKILKRRKVKGKLQYFVRWDGFPKSFDSWIDVDQVNEK